MTHAELKQQLDKDRLAEFYATHIRNIDNKLKLINNPQMGGLMQVDLVTSSEGAEALRFYRKLIVKQLSECRRKGFFIRLLRGRS